MGQFSFPIFAKRAKPNILFWLGAFVLRVVFAASTCRADMDPSRDFVRAPGEAGDLDEGFDQDWRHSCNGRTSPAQSCGT